MKQYKNLYPLQIYSSHDQIEVRRQRNVLYSYKNFLTVYYNMQIIDDLGLNPESCIRFFKKIIRTYDAMIKQIKL